MATYFCLVTSKNCLLIFFSAQTKVVEENEKSGLGDEFTESACARSCVFILGVWHFGTKIVKIGKSASW